MTANDCLQMFRQLRDVTFATVSKSGRPEARIIDIMLADSEGLYFCTARGKDFYEQLLRTGEAAVVGLTKNWQMLRLNGTVTKLDDQKYWIDRIFEENPSMNGVYPGDARYILEPFAIKHGEIECFDLGTTPIHRESFSLGGGNVTTKGYLITDGCIGCGTCADLCPQRAIDEGAPYSIRQENCLHCGLCFENCPVSAIVNREEC
jgi:uncharacterized pyridoxamine 5'-phosphate oxidase family protein